LRRAPVFCWHFELEKEPMQITGFSDSDWAGDEKTRKSTSGGILLLETGCEEEEQTIAAVHAWSRAQGPIALSSMEAEYYALITTCQEARGLQSLLEEVLGRRLPIILRTDSDAARLAIEKRGSLHCKHMELRHLFLKELQSTGIVQLMRVTSKKNTADLLTKILNQVRITEILNDMMACWEVKLISD
jgi:hypothetical protein